VLAHLRPVTLQSLRMEWMPADAAAAVALGRLSSLTYLQIECCGCLPDSLLAALPSLRQLLCLKLSGTEAPAELPGTVRPLTRLTHFACRTTIEPLPPLSSLFQLTQLCRLEWMEGRQAGMLRLNVQPLLARLPQLGSWRIGSRRLRRQSLQVRASSLLGIGGTRWGLGACACVHLASAHACKRVPAFGAVKRSLSLPDLRNAWLCSPGVQRQQAPCCCSTLPCRRLAAL